MFQRRDWDNKNTIHTPIGGIRHAAQNAEHRRRLAAGICFDLALDFEQIFCGSIDLICTEFDLKSAPLK